MRRPTSWLRPQQRCGRCGEVIESVEIGGPLEDRYGRAICQDCAYESDFPIAVRGLRDSEQGVA